MQMLHYADTAGNEYLVPTSCITKISSTPHEQEYRVMLVLDSADRRVPSPCPLRFPRVEDASAAMEQIRNVLGTGHFLDWEAINRDNQIL